MAHYMVDVTDLNGKTVRLAVSLPPVGQSTWKVKEHKFLRLQQGVVDTGKSAPDSPGSWLACYGAPEIDDSKLVLHLDDFLSRAQINRSGSGKLYNHDNLLLRPGPVNWNVPF